MNLMEIPDTLYRVIRDQEVARFLGMGFGLGAARERATEVMTRCFVARSTALTTECQADKDHERIGEWGDEVHITSHS